MRYKIHPLNGIAKNVISRDGLEHICPEPAYITLASSDVDGQMMIYCLSAEDFKQLWSGNADSIITDDEIITSY